MRYPVLILSVTLLLALITLPSSAEKTNNIVVKLRPEASLEELQLSHPKVKFERQSTLPRVFLFSVENINEVDQETYEFTTDPRVAWAHIDETTELQPEFTPTDPSLQSGDQWYNLDLIKVPDPHSKSDGSVKNNLNTINQDLNRFHSYINTSYAWSKGFSGQGQLVQVIDTPVVPNDRDLQNQIDFERSFGGNVIPPAGPVIRPHGTVCTNLLVGQANDFCGVGVAFSARAAIFPFIANDARVFTEVEVAEAYALGFSVSSNSYGTTMCWQMWGCNLERALSPVILEALELAQARNNTVWVFTAGNDGRFQGSPNFRSFGSTPRIITVGATRINGTRAIYSNVGPANWIVAPAGDVGRVTWSSAVSSEGQHCGEVGTGTSYAAPMVAGAAAILRSAYPSLTWRDVKIILAHSSDKTDPDHQSWVRNGAGRWFSNHYGFGQLNVGKAVEIAASWNPVGPLQIRTFHSTLAAPIVLDENATVITPQLSVPRGVISRIESVQLTLDMTIGRRGVHQIELISPAGTACTVFSFRQDQNRNYRNYVTTVNCFLDEDPAGTWTLRSTRQMWPSASDFFNSFAVTVWGQAIPSQVQVLTSPAATRLSQFTITEGDTFQQLTLFHNYPDVIGLFWKDNFGLYGELFTTQGKATSGTHRLNPSYSDHPTISVFDGNDHVLTYATLVDGAVVMKSEVRNINFIPLTPLTDLPVSNIDPQYTSVAAVEDNLIVATKASATSFSKLMLLDVKFGSRDVTPVCIPALNATEDAVGSDVSSDGNCTEIEYRRDGSISFAKQSEIKTQSPVTLQSIGMNLVLGTWASGQNVFGSLIRADLGMNTTRLKATPNSIIRAVATPEDVLIAHVRPGSVVVERFDMKMRQQEVYTIDVINPINTIDLTYTPADGLSLLIATSKDVSLTAFLRSSNKTFVQTNRATISSLLSNTYPVLGVHQSVMPNGDLAVTFSTIQEIHVQVFKSTVFGSLTATPLPTITPIALPPPPTKPPVAVAEPVAITKPGEQPITVDDIINKPDKVFPAWGIALIVIAAILAIIVAIVMRMDRKNAAHRAQDVDMVAYTKMNV